MEEQKELLELSELCIGYEKKTIVSDISVTVNQGDYIAIIGENGTGKSTLIQTLLGFIPAVSGKMNWINKKARIGYLPQQTTLQRDFPASVAEIVYSGFLCEKRRRFIYSKEEKKTAHHIMDELGILALEKQCYRELSGGQQQRVLLARALCTTKDILILDEPVNGLDVYAIKDFYDRLRKINQIKHTTILMVTHDLERIQGEASHFLKLDGEGSYLFEENTKRGEMDHE